MSAEPQAEALPGGGDFVNALTGRTVAAQAAMSDAGTDQPRLARPEDADALRRIIRKAYTHYIERIGKPPGPMLDDYAKRIKDGQA